MRFPRGIRRATMAFDFEKEYKEFYLPKSKPEIIRHPVKKR